MSRAALIKDLKHISADWADEATNAHDKPTTQAEKAFWMLHEQLDNVIADHESRTDKTIEEAQNEIRQEYAPVLNQCATTHSILHRWSMEGNSKTHNFGFSRRDMALELMREVFGDVVYHDQLRKIEEYRKMLMAQKRANDKRLKKNRVKQ